MEQRQRVKLTTARLSLFALAMFGFGYALVPLYDVFCELAGINGKTGTISVSDGNNAIIDHDRLVTVEFDTNINGDLPWDFRAIDLKMQVRPGRVTEAMFVAENRSDRAITGQAVPSVAPAQASLYFDKTECFCFTQQRLGPGEKKQMPVRFVVNAHLPKKISTLTLSYTFFQSPQNNKPSI